MCELLGISSSRPVRARSLLTAFRRRGGETADNPDGWGLAFVSNNHFALHKEPLPAAGSGTFLEISAAMETDLLIGHVRKARLPRVNTFTNTHPFRHSCCGRDWVFAHNGLVPEAIELAQRAAQPPCTPTGETDSEHAFCHLLDNVARYFQETPPNGVASWITELGTVSGAIAAHGKFNFLISDGVHLIAYGHDRLHRLERRENRKRAIRGARPSPRSHRRNREIEQVWIATEPLTEESWQPFEPGELCIYRRGRLVGRVASSISALPAALGGELSMHAA
jgi:glutamine amidotransferase